MLLGGRAYFATTTIADLTHAVAVSALERAYTAQDATAAAATAARSREATVAALTKLTRHIGPTKAF